MIKEKECPAVFLSDSKEDIPPPIENTTFEFFVDVQALIEEELELSICRRREGEKTIPAEDVFKSLGL